MTPEQERKTIKHIVDITEQILTLIAECRQEVADCRKDLIEVELSRSKRELNLLNAQRLLHDPGTKTGPAGTQGC